MSWGSITFPKDLLIFRPSPALMNPWLKTDLGTGKPALSNIAGQYTC